MNWIEICYVCHIIQLCLQSIASHSGRDKFEVSWFTTFGHRAFIRGSPHRLRLWLPGDMRRPWRKDSVCGSEVLWATRGPRIAWRWQTLGSFIWLVITKIFILIWIHMDSLTLLKKKTLVSSTCIFQTTLKKPVIHPCFGLKYHHLHLDIKLSYG